ncbi:hypothetical protein LguiB_012834 [Lonicera macranthoides]
MAFRSQNTHPPIKSNDSDPPSSNLWVGNLAGEVTESDLMNLFKKQGEIDNITLYSARSYAFVHFKRIEEAIAARSSLQGIVLCGNALKIEFTKPARPCKSLWVGGIGASVSKEVLEGHFLKFGKIEDIKFFRDRNTAFVDYFRLEDAWQALKSMNGKRIGDGQIRVDFLRSHPSRKEQWHDSRDGREGQFSSRNLGQPDLPWVPQDFTRNYSEPVHSSFKRPHSSGVTRGDGLPSNVLCITYPPSFHMDEQMLHNAMILFGEIENIKSFPPSHQSLVEFRSVEEAKRAKEGLEGKLFSDPRILITYSGTELAISNDYPGFSLGMQGTRPDMFFNGGTYRPPPMDIFNHNRLVIPTSLPSHLPVQPPHVIPGPNILTRPLGHQSSFEPPVLPGQEVSDLANLHALVDTKPNWRSSPGVRSSSPGVKPSIRPISGNKWDVFDESQLQRGFKRSRTDGALPAPEHSSSLKQMDGKGLGFDQSYGLGPRAIVQGRNRSSSPAETRFTPGGTARALHSETDYVWRGIIAKGGTPVCSARCVPIGEGIGFEIPEIVNCSARTGLDMLTKHYADAVGFDIIFFLPDSEEDFAPYTEFLRYLGDRNRAGVAKFDDGTTLFLVPPSDFLTKVLNVNGPERLYGVVLNFPQHTPSTPPPQPQYVDRQQFPSRIEYNSVMPREERGSHIDYKRVSQIDDYKRGSHEDSKHPLKSLGSPASDTVPPHAVPPTNTAAISQAGLSLTPELIATLASLLPAKENSPCVQPSPRSSTLRPLSTAASDRGLHQVWSEQGGQPPQQVGSQFDTNSQYLPQIQDYAHGVAGGNTQIQDPIYDMSQQGAVSSGQSYNFTSPSQSGPFAVSTQVNQQYGLEDSQNVYQRSHGTDTFGLYGSSVLHQPATNPVTVSNQAYGANVSSLASEKSNLDLLNQVQQLQPSPYGAGQGTSEVEFDKSEQYRSTLQFAVSNQAYGANVSTVAAEKSNFDHLNPMQQLQPSPYGTGQGTAEVEVDKNERYKSTLQFAANLLFQVQQQQQQRQQPGTQAGQGSGNH